MAEGSSTPMAPGDAWQSVDSLGLRGAQYHFLAEQVSDTIVRVDTKGVIQYISPGCRALGYEPEDLVGLPGDALVHPEDLERFRANTVELLSGAPVDRALDREIRYRRKDGKWAWLAGNPRVIRDEAGRPLEILNVFRDVTARKEAEFAAARAEAERRAKAELFENAFHHAAVGMALVGLDGRFLKINPAFCRLVGYSKAAMLDLDFQTITHPDDLDADLNLLAQLTAGAISSYRLDKRYIRADGEIVWVGLSVSMVTGDDGAPAHYVAQVQDQTARRGAEQALAESERRFRRLAENAPDMITESRLDGVITYVSPASTAIIGFAPEELVGRTFAGVVRPEDGAKVFAMCQAVFKSKGALAPWPVEFRATHKDGRELWLECKPTLVMDPKTGRFTGLTDIVRDVTARKTLEADLRQARAEAEAATAVKSEFLANMSHEIRTPLTAILGFANLLSERHGLDETGRAHLERVLTASRSLLSIVNDVLDFSKLEAGCVELAPQPVSPVDFTHETLLMFAPQAEAKGLSLDFIAEGELPSHVALDPDRFRQILFNLIGNAIKFTRDGGVRLRLAYEPAVERLGVEITDTGPGLGASDQARLFQRFAQVDGSSTRQHGGTGLGLAISKGLSEAMGGQIGVRSTAGQGSTFWFHVQAPPAEAPGELDADEAAAGLDGVRVLVVDDNPVNRELARAVLESAGAEVSLAVDGEDAVAQAATTPFDLILLDRRMPGMDGPKTLNRIRAEPGPNDSIPILAFSADTDIAGLIGPGGFEDVVGKPVEASVLIGAVARWTRWDDPASPREVQDGAFS